MIIPSQYILNQKIVSLLQNTEHLKTKLDLLPQDKTVEEYHRQKSILKSAVYSARIEGNPRMLSEVNLTNINNKQDISKLELNNLYKTLEYILSKQWEYKITLKDLKYLHHLVLKNISSTAGSLRTEPSAVFNEAGVAIYVCPMPEEIPDLLNSWLKYVNNYNEQFSVIKAALAHYSFEKIHPFLDANGRVGRLLIHLILKKENYDLKGLVPFEEFFEKNKQDYYYFLNLNKKYITSYIEYFIGNLNMALKNTLAIQDQKEKLVKEDLLPLRRQEILNIIRDHKQVSLDFIKRRFITVSRRLLSYDLKKLQEAKFIKKRGITRGVIYEPNN